MLPPDSVSMATVFIVSDDVPLTADLVGRLKRLGYDIVGRAPGLKEVSAMIEQHRPQLIMLDVGVLADLGGLDAVLPVVAKWSVPVVLLLAPTDAPKVLAARFPHPFWYLLKPIPDRELQFTMNLACQALAAASQDQPTISDLAVNERHFRLLAENAGDVIFTLNMDLRYTYVSPSVLKLRGFGASEVMEQTLDEVLTPESLSLATRVISEELAAEELGGADPDRTRTMELEMKCQDGSTVWTEVKSSFLRDENGQAVGILGITRDLTERKREEELRRESEVTYHALFDNMLNGLAYCRMIFEDGLPCDFIYLAVNDAFESQTGLKNVIGRKATEVIPGLRESDPELFEIYGRVAQTGRPERFEMFVEALQMWFSVSVYSYKPEHFVAVFDVITEQKRIHKALRDSQARLHLCLEAAQAGTWEWDLKTNENVWSEELWRLYGLEPNSVEPSFDSWLSSILPDDREKAAAVVQEASRLGKKLKTEWRVATSDGTIRWLMSSGQPIRDDNGRIVRYLGVVIDITERVMAEAALKESECNYRMLVDNSSDIVWKFDLGAMAFTFFSNSGEHLLGYSLEAGQRMTLDNMFSPETKKQVLAAFGRVYEGKSDSDRVRLEAEHRTRNGDRIWLEINAVLQRDESGHPISFTGSSRDITERKLAEKALKKSEENFRKFFEDDLTGDFITDINGAILDCNPAFIRMFGYQAKSEVIERNVAEFYPDPTERIVILDRLRTDRMLERYETVRKRQDGGLIIVDENIVGIYGEDGNLTEVKGYVYDITGRKRAEEELQKSESRLRAIFEHSPLGMILFDAEGTIISCNEKFAELMGSTVEKLTGFNTARQSTPEMQDTIKQALAGHTAVYEDLYTSITGHKTLYLRVVFNPVHPGRNPTPVIATLEDITERKQAEQALKDSESRYRLITDTLTDYIYTVYFHDHQVHYTQHSPACAVITGYTPDEFSADPYLWINIVVEEDRERLQEWVSYLHQGLDPGAIEHRLHRKDGQVIWVRDTPAVKYGPTHELISYDGLIQDITEHMQAEEALRESETRFRQLFDNMADGVAIYRAVDDGLDFVFVDINRQGQKNSHVTLEQAVGKRVTVVFPAVTQIGLLDAFRRVYQTGRPEELPLVLYKDGRIEEWVENYVFKLPSGLIVALYSDTSETHRARMVKEQLQEQLAQARKLEAIGTLAGGVAHDFNNLLQAITGYTQIMLLDKEPTDPDYPNLEAIQQAGDRASELVRQLLLFSRKADSARRPVSLNLEIQQTRRMLERTIPKMIEIEVRPDSRLWNVNADPVQIEQILLNLGGNAADAMPDGGTLTIETSNVVLDADYAKINLGAKPGRYVLLSVSDTGHGMDSETVAKIFEPFFTTKEIGKGTGLGLASVYGIVTGHGGYIHCYSEIGRGTTFTIYLPAIEESDSENSKMPSTPTPPRGGTETILLVDDEEPIRSFASQVLTKFGYKVLTAASGEAALDIYSARGRQIDLVITDIGMPGIGGHRCLQELIRVNPEAKVLIASGYSINGQMKKTLEERAAGYVGKPYQIKELLDTVRTVLDCVPKVT